MSDNIGLICYADDEEEVFIGRDLAHAKNYSEGIASAIDAEVKRIIDESYDKAKSMIADVSVMALIQRTGLIRWHGSLCLPTPGRRPIK